MTAGIDVRKRAQPAARGVVRPDHLELRELEDSQVVAAYLAGRGRAFDEIVDR
jgi:hypothetical protein